MSTEPTPLLFADLGLSAPVMASVTEVGYESPSPIQAATIPALLAGKDVLGQAQTGTGKTAAFALPILARLDLRPAQAAGAGAGADPRTGDPGRRGLPALRHATCPASTSCRSTAARATRRSCSALKRGVHVVVGTPGRVIDHLERGSLDLSELRCLVLDEADEMLRMGFIDDVEAVLKKTPPTRQVALFSATMPTQIRRIAQTYLQAIRSRSRSSPRPPPRPISASATGWSAACTSSMR